MARRHCRAPFGRSRIGGARLRRRRRPPPVNKRTPPPDAVFHEATAASGKLGAEEILDWYRGHMDAVRIEPTEVFQDEMSLREIAGRWPSRDLGERAALELIRNLPMGPNERACAISGGATTRKSAMPAFRRVEGLRTGQLAARPIGCGARRPSAEGSEHGFRPARRHHHGQPVRLADAEGRRRMPGRTGRRLRGQGGLRPPHARAAVRLRQGRRRPAASR